MASLIKGIVRIGVVGGIVVGAGVLIAGPQRIGAIGRQVQMKLMSAIDKHIDDPIAMRSQLRDLESKYPKRIADARAMLGELHEQIRQVDRDQTISQRVVSLAQNDLNDMKDLLSRAEDARSGFAGAGQQTVLVSFNHQKMNLDEAYTQANRIADTVTSYQARVVECSQELAHLNQDARQTESLLSKLQTEYTDFQTQLADLDRKIDTVARKERMVTMMKDRQQRIDELSRYKAESLDQFKTTLANRVAQLDARLESLSGSQDRVNYEQRAKLQVDTATSARLRLDRATSPDVQGQTETVITEEPAPAPTTETVQSGRVAIR